MTPFRYLLFRKTTVKTITQYLSSQVEASL